MLAQGGVKLRPIAAVYAVVLLLCGLVAAASVVAQIEINNKLHLWPHSMGSWFAWSIVLPLAAAGIGVLAIVCAIVGVLRRGALHLGGLVLLASTACAVVGLVIDNVKFHLPWFGNGASVWHNYRYGLTWHKLPAGFGFHRWWFFAEYLLLPLTVLGLLAWLVVALTGAGSRAQAPASAGYAYGLPPQADYRYVIDQEAPVADAAVDAPYREIPVTVEPHEKPLPSQSAPEPDAPAEPVVEPVVEPEPAADVPDVPDIPDVDSVRQAAEADEAAQPGDDERVWFVTVQGGDHGPYSRNQLQTYLAEGRLHDGTVTHVADGAEQALSDVLS